MIRDVEHRRSPPRGSLRPRRRDDTRVKEEVKEEPEDVKPLVLLAGYEVPPALQDEAHDGDIPGLSFALVESVSEIERDSPGFLETVLRSAQMAASASTSRAPTTARPPPAPIPSPPSSSLTIAATVSTGPPSRSRFRLSF